MAGYIFGPGWVKKYTFLGKKKRYFLMKRLSISEKLYKMAGGSKSIGSAPQP